MSVFLQHGIIPTLVSPQNVRAEALKETITYHEHFCGVWQGALFKVIYQTPQKSFVISFIFSQNL
jgi:hypothetical protein